MATKKFVYERPKKNSDTTGTTTPSAFTEFLNSQSASKLTIIRVNLSQLIEHEGNEYSMSKIIEMADSIQNVGLLQPLLIKETGEVSSEGLKKYRIYAGHRRYRGLREVVYERGVKDYEYIDCILLKEGEDETISEIKLHIANAENREQTEYDKMFSIRELERLIKEAKAKGYPIVGNTRDIIAKEVGLQKTQTQKYMTVDKKATKTTKQELREGNITLTQAYDKTMQESKKTSPTPAVIEKKIEEIQSNKDTKVIFSTLKTFKDACARIDDEEINKAIQALEELIKKVIS